MAGERVPATRQRGGKKPVNILQLLANTLLTASCVVLVGLGFSLIYRTTKFFNLAYGVLFTAWPYIVLLLNSELGLSLPIAIPLAVVAVGLIGSLLDVFVYRQLRHKGASPLILLIASLGIYVVLQNIISIIFGDESRSIRLGEVEGGINVLGARLTLIQISIICVSAAMVAGVVMVLRLTKIGLAIRAVGNSPQLAGVSGISNNRVVLWTGGIASALAGTGGILVAMDVNMTPTMGMQALMMGVVAVIVGGIGRIGGIVLGALLLATAQHCGVWTIGSQWQDAIAFVILLIFLIVRPEGFLGKKVRKATV